MEMQASSSMPLPPTPSPSKFNDWNRNYLHQQCGFYLALTLYAFYIFLIITKTTKAMKPYQKVLGLHCVIDFLFIFPNLLLHGEYPCLMTDRGLACFRLVTAPWVYPSRYWIWIAERLNTLATVWNIPGVAVIFLYRYLLICRSYEVKLPLFILASIVSLMIPGTITGVLDFYRNWPKAEDLYYDKYFNSSEWLYEGRIPTYTVPNVPSTIFESTAAIIPSYFSYLIIFFTTYRIQKTLNSLQNRNARIKRMQTEMTIVLWIQALLPLFSHIIPFTSTFFAFFFNFNLSFIFYFTKISIWAPAINVGLSMFIIGPYRSFIREFILFCVKPKPEVASVSAITLT